MKSLEVPEWQIERHTKTCQNRAQRPQNSRDLVVERLRAVGAEQLQFAVREAGQIDRCIDVAWLRLRPLPNKV